MDEENIYRGKTQNIYDRYAIPRKAWMVEGRNLGQILMEYGGFESREKADSALEKIYADKEWQELTKRRVEEGVVVPGTQELYFLTD